MSMDQERREAIRAKAREACVSCAGEGQPVSGKVAEVARLQGEASRTILVPAFTADAAVEAVAAGNHYRGQRDDSLLAKEQSWFTVRIAAGKVEP